MNRKIVIKKCPICNKDFNAHMLNRGRMLNKYCSKQCVIIAKQNPILEFKKCRKCGEVKHIDKFNLDKRNNDKHSGTCRNCNNLRCYAYEKTERGKQVKRKYHSSLKGRLQQARMRFIHRKERKARWILQRAVDSGRIIKPQICSCGNNLNIEAHHPDYNKSLDVVWLCRTCHKKIHKSDVMGVV